MVENLVTLPLRVTLRTSVFALRTARGLTEAAWHVADQTLGAVLPGRPGAGGHPPDPGRHGSPAGDPQPSAGRRDPGRSGEVDPRRADAPPPVTTTPPAPPAPEVREPEIEFDEPAPISGEGRVSEEAELVAEYADPGALDGAGAEIHVREPWPGYGAMSARDVTARLGASDPAELLAARLYETSNRNRQSVLTAIENKLRGKTT